MSQWRDPPGVVILSGDEEFLRVRELREAVALADEVGRSVQYVEGPNRDEISRVLSSTGVFFREDVLLVVENPEKVDAEMVLRHHESGNRSVVILLHQEGKIKAGTPLAKVAAELPKRLVAKFDKPKPWEEADHALGFCLDLAKKYSLKLPEPLARGIVQHVGTDLGMLSFELQKLAIYMEAEHLSEPTAVHVKQTLGAFTELGPKPIIEALERKDGRATANALNHMRRTHAGHLSGATMRACAFVASSATKWLHVAALLAEGAEVPEIRDRTGLHEFVIRKTMIPTAKRWGQGSLTSLLKAIARVERSVRSGHVNPWVQLETALITAATSN